MTGRSRIVATVTAAAILLAACVVSAVQLRNPTTGQTTQCGPYTMIGGGGSSGHAAAEVQARCLDDYEKQGFLRVP
jgi:hypothetical protein